MIIIEENPLEKRSLERPCLIKWREVKRDTMYGVLTSGIVFKVNTKKL